MDTSITKCIVVHLTGDPRYMHRLKIAADLARRFDAHLDIVYALGPAHNPAPAIGRAMSMEYLKEAAEAATAAAARAEQEVKRFCDANVKSWTWYLEGGDVEEIVDRYAHLADLVVVDQHPQGLLEDLLESDMTEHLLMSAGCSLLLVPTTWTDAPIGKDILIAWKNSREAISAVRSSLTFLRSAESVQIVAEAGDKKRGSSSGEDLQIYLSYHGVAATVLDSSNGQRRDILKIAQEHNRDLIVMGSSGHSRFSRWIFGDLTEHVLRHTKVPVLMRH
ncbi:MAG: universal stress protein [Hyphomicrobiales bacterium]|nr:universal stress protein [Hyphomicrobiales bacterium]